MGKRVSHSLLDPWVAPWVPRLYRLLPIPRAFPPEGIVLGGHLLGAAAAVGFAFSTVYWWGGLLGAVGVAGNHLADMIDGTHARRTGQCRNGGELLDHFTDPLSFSYWMVGFGASVERLDLALAAVIIIYATALLTSLRAKLTGEFILARFGPTEMKALFVLYGLVLTVLLLRGSENGKGAQVALGFLVFLVVLGVLQLVWNLVSAVRHVNREGAAPDTSDWEIASRKKDA